MRVDRRVGQTKQWRQLSDLAHYDTNKTYNPLENLSVKDDDDADDASDA